MGLPFIFVCRMGKSCIYSLKLLLAATGKPPFQISANLSAQCLAPDARKHGLKRCLNDELLCIALIEATAHQIEKFVRIDLPNANRMMSIHIPLMREHERNAAVARMRREYCDLLILFAGRTTRPLDEIQCPTKRLYTPIKQRPTYL